MLTAPLFEVSPANCYGGDQNVLVNLAVDHAVAEADSNAFSSSPNVPSAGSLAM